MARSDDMPTQVMLQNGKKIFLQKIAFTTTAGATAIAAIDAEGNVIEAGATIMAQADQDFFYQVINSTASTSVTNLAGARPGTFVNGQAQEFVHIGTKDGKLDIVASTTSGTVVLFHVV